jgi:hypothetical protein
MLLNQKDLKQAESLIKEYSKINQALSPVLVPNGSLPPNNQGSLKSSTDKIKPITTVIETSKAQNVSDVDNFLAACRFAGTV